VIHEHPNHRALLEPLVRAGYAVVAAEAGGNAFGNPASLDDYRQLMNAARTKFGAEPMIFVAESMGALPALSLLREDTEHRIRGMVGITPLMGLPANMRTVDFVANAWHGSVPDTADPMQWPPDTFAGRAFQLYQADQDKIIPYGARARDFARRFGGSADVSVIPCSGPHVSPKCYDAAGVGHWVASLGG
jgi:alpha-beta hydrolase superfamily lysophospholipase